MAARSAEVGGDLLARRIADRPMVLYRTDEGVVALDDRCPHRWLPLSKGCRAPHAAAMGVEPGSLVDRRNESRVPTLALHRDDDHIATTTLRSPAGHGHEYRGAVLHTLSLSR
ncbi:Rieske 2Fe-2S domain-containing protein [Pseudofrankia sp. BMG5.37]|uniref:Rieske 2Fe-2S domain-containing protein n=1 Tax=Pseudofrankia sp. BMG5.37 TaxID=3050035 RepID=UPI0028962258|nr:Rieske 2Fe-2S domain-containing protein [Pseudofrankia sp. BMG5.37]MDT3447021.1 Rieske 2Fe-2S domain-containing protein [Pseudofrankia sp. BMG5.37]